MKCPKCGATNNNKAKFCHECSASLISPVETVIEETVNNETQLDELKSALKGKYKIIREIGRGGMGIVYECKEISLDRTVALKVLPRELTYDKKFVERFKNEIKVLAKIEHQNIVPLLSADESNGFIYFTMKYVKGQTLADIIKDKGELDSKETMRIVLQIAQALSCAHDQNVIHRDLKPENIMIDNNHIYVMDFGIARALEGTRMTRTGSTIGTPEYMSPEQCSGESEPDGRSDIYSLGVIMYEMLTGIVPFKGEATSVMYQHVHAEPVSLTKLAKNASIEIINIVNTCLEKKPEKRPQSAQGLISLINNSIENKIGIKKWNGHFSTNKIVMLVLKILLLSKRKIVIMLLALILISSYLLLWGVKRRDLPLIIADYIPVFYLKFFESTYIGYYSDIYHKDFSYLYFERCKINNENKKYKDAIYDCTKAIDLYKTDTQATDFTKEKIIETRVESKVGVEDYEGAISDYNYLIKGKPGNKDYYLKRAYAKASKDDYNGAFIDLNIALEIDPNNAITFYNRAGIKYWKGDYLGALDDINKAIDIDQNDFNFYNLRGIIKYKDGKTLDAIPDFSKAIELNNNDGTQFFYRGIAKHDLGDVVGAKSDYRRAIALDGEYVDTYVELGDKKIEKGDIGMAITYYTRAIEINPYNAEAFKKRAEAKKQNGDNSGYQADMEKFKSLK